MVFIQNDFRHSFEICDNGSFIKKFIKKFSIIKTTLNKNFFATETYDKVLSLTKF